MPRGWRTSQLAASADPCALASALHQQPAQMWAAEMNVEYQQHPSLTASAAILPFRKRYYRYAESLGLAASLGRGWEP